MINEKKKIWNHKKISEPLCNGIKMEYITPKVKVRRMQDLQVLCQSVPQVGVKSMTPESADDSIWLQ